MLVTTKISLALSGAALVLFGSFGAWLMHVEQDDLRLVAQRELRLLARSLQVSTQHALRDSQHADIELALAMVKKVESTVDVLIFNQDLSILRRSEAADLPTPAELAGLRRAVAEQERQIVWDDDASPPRLAVALPLREAGNNLGSLLVVRSLHDLNEDLARTRKAIASAVALFAVAASLLAFGLGQALFGKPLRALAGAMDRVQQGHLDQVPKPTGRDEITDITEHFNGMVGELARARQHSAETGEQLRQLQTSLQEANKLIAVGQLSAGLAHEIGSPLQVLVGRAALISDVAERPAEVRRHAKILGEQTQRIGRIVTQLLEFARRRPRHGQAGNPADAIGQVVELMTAAARKAKVTLHADLTSAPLRMADTDALQQIALNLLSNAVHATPAQGRIEVKLAADALPSGVPAVLLQVRDTGSGMDDAVRERLFEPFFTTRAAQGGTGLGMAVVGSLVSELSGKVQVDSQVGSGTQVQVWLPIDKEAT